MVTLELRAKEKEGEIVLLTGRVELQEAELRSECHTCTSGSVLFSVLPAIHLSSS